MAAFALVHGAADVGWYWHLVERELRARDTRPPRRTCRARTTRPDWRSTPIRWPVRPAGCAAVT